MVAMAVIAAVASVTGVVIGIATHLPGSTSDDGTIYRPPSSPTVVVEGEPEPCVPVHMVPSQEVRRADGGIEGADQGTSLPICPDAVSMILNVQSLVTVDLGLGAVQAP